MTKRKYKKYNDLTEQIKRIEKDDTIIIDEIIKKSNYIKSFIIDYGSYKHIPLINKKGSANAVSNWALPPMTVNNITKNEKSLLGYASLVLSGMIKHVLPPWIVFPLITSPSSVEWKKGIAKKYIEFFNIYITSMKNEDVKAYSRYKKLYPIPALFKMKYKKIFT